MKARLAFLRPSFLPSFNILKISTMLKNIRLMHAFLGFFFSKIGIVCIFFATPLFVFGMESFQILDQHPSVSITKPLSILRVSLTREEAYDAFTQNHFEILPTPNRSFGFYDKAIWMGIEIDNGCTHDLFLSFADQSLQNIEYFVYQKGILIAQGQTGIQIPFHKRIAQAYDLRLPVLPYHEPLTYLIKISTTSPLITPVVLGTDGTIMLFHLPKIIGMTLFGGVFLALFLYNCILFITTKEKDYLLYSFYIFSLFCLMVSIREYFSFFLQDALFLNGSIKLVSLLASVFFLILFTLEFLSIKSVSIRLHRFTRYALVVILLMMCTMPFGLIGKYIGISALFLTLFLAFFLGIFAKIRGNPLSIFYLIAVGGFFLGVMNMLGIILGILPYSLITHMTPMMGSAWEMILFSLALGYKIRFLSQEHTKAIMQIQAQNKMLFLQSRYTSVGELIRNITHQWKEPLGEIGAIQTNLKSSLLFQGGVSKEKLINAIDLSHNIIAHLAETIDTFYRFFRSQNSEQSEFNAVKEIDNIQKMVKYTFETEQIELQFTYQHPYILLYGHPNEFAHAILNIILNAKEVLIQRHIKHPFVHIDISSTPDEIIVRIEDNGGGIIQKPLEKIFEVGTSAYKENIGIGLFIAKTIVEQKMSGSIYVQNTLDGALFSLCFPTAHAQLTLRQEPFLSIEESALQRISRLEKDIERYVEIEKNLQHWAHIFEKAHWGIAICEARSKVLTLMNPSFLQMYGYSESELHHQSIVSLFSDEWQERINEIFTIVDQTNQYTFEATHVRKNTQLFPVDIDLISVKTAANETLYYILNVRDITHYKNTHKRLLLKTFAMEHIHEAVFLVDKNAQFQYVNHEACRALGYTQEELLQLKISDIDALWPSEAWKGHWNTLESQKTVTLETLHKRKDGTVFPVEVVVNYIEYDDAYFAMGLARDISERRLLEERKSDEQMRLFFEKQIIGMAISSPDKYWLRVNERLCTMFGYSQEELLAITWEELTYAEDREPDVRQFERVLKGEIEGFSMPKRFLKKDGSLIYTNLSTTCIRKEDGTADYFLTSIEDITEQVKAHEILIQKEKELRLLADSSPGMMGTFYRRPDGTVCMPYVSPNIFELFGLYPHEVIDDAAALLQITHPEDSQRVLESIARSAQTMSLWHEEYRIIHPTKGIRWMESSTRPQPHPEGGVIWYGYVHDITERKEGEFILDEARQRLHSLLQSIPDPVWMKDANGRFIACNHGVARLFNTQEEEIIGKDDYDFFEPELAEFYRHKDRSAVEADHVRVNEELWTFRDNGEQALMETRKVPLKSKDGTLLGVIGVARDITERKKIEEKLKQNEARLNKAQNIAKIGSWELDIDSDTLTWSDETFRIFELDREQTTDLHKIFYEIVHPEDREKVSGLYLESVKAKRPYSVEHRIVMRDGRIKYVIETCETQYDEEGNPTVSIGTVQDITERYQMGMAIKETNERYTQILDNSIDVIYLIEVTPEGHFIHLDVNTAYEKVTGIPRDVAVGLDVEDIENEAFRAILVDKFTACLKAGQITDYIADYPSPGGIRTFHSVLAPIRDKSGHIVRIVGAARDITERKQFENTIQELNATLEAKVEQRTLQLQQALEFSNGVINALPDLLFEIDLNGTYLNVWARDEELLAKHKELLLGHNVYDVLSHEAADTVMEALQEAHTKGTSFGKTIKIELPQETMYFEESVSKKMSSDTFLLLSHDITERKKAEIELIEREEKFSKLFKLSPAAISITSLERGMYLDVNDSFLRHTQYAYEEVVGKSSAELGLFVNSEDRAELFRQVQEHGHISDFEYAYRTKRGRIGYASAYGSIIHFKGERCFIGHSYDITERKNAEIALAQSKEAFRAMVDNSPDVIARYGLDYRRLYVNPQMQRLLCDQPLDVILQSSLERYSPLADVKDFQKKLQSVIEHKQEMTFEAPFFMPDRNVHWGLIRLIPEFNADKDVISVLLVGHDITLEKETLKGLELFKTAIDKSDQAIYIIDENNVIIFVNAKACKILDYTPEELIGQFIWKIDTFMTQEEILAISQKVRQGETFRFETKHHTREGSIIDVEVKSTLFYFEQTEYNIAFVTQRTHSPLTSFA